MSMNKAQAGKKVAKKPVKKRTPHPNDDYKDMVDPATGKKGTMGGEGTRPPFTPEERRKMPRVGNMGSAKNGKSFPDLNKDGKITRADILKGRGVIAKKGATVKKAQNGTLQPMGKNSRKVGEGKYVSEDGNYKLKFKGGSDTSAPTSAVQRRTLKGFLKGAPKAGFKTKMAQNGTAIKQQKLKKDYDSKIKGVKGMSENEKVKKGITKLVPLASQIKANVMPPKPPKKKMGGSMKKCKYGCK